MGNIPGFTGYKGPLPKCKVTQLSLAAQKHKFRCPAMNYYTKAQCHKGLQGRRGGMGPSALGPLSHLGQVAHTGSLALELWLVCMLVDSVNDNRIRMSGKMLACLYLSPSSL